MGHLDGFRRFTLVFRISRYLEPPGLLVNLAAENRCFKRIVNSKQIIVLTTRFRDRA